MTDIKVVNRESALDLEINHKRLLCCFLGADDCFSLTEPAIGPSNTF